MADLVFRCSACSKSLVIDERGVGLTVQCVDCEAPLAVPAADIHFECESCGCSLAVPSGLEHTPFQCPSCDETVQLEKPALEDQFELPAAERQAAETLADEKLPEPAEPTPEEQLELPELPSGDEEDSDEPETGSSDDVLGEEERSEPATDFLCSRRRAAASATDKKACRCSCRDTGCCTHSRCSVRTQEDMVHGRYRHTGIRFDHGRSPSSCDT